MSNETPNKEQEIARFQELSAKPKLKAAEREELETLKEKYPELDTDNGDEEGDENESGDESDEEENDEEEEEEEDEQEKEPEKPKTSSKGKGRKPKEKELEAPFYVLKENVLHSGDSYEKGQKLPKDHPIVPEFLKQGLLE